MSNAQILAILFGAILLLLICFVLPFVFISEGVIEYKNKKDKENFKDEDK